MKHAKQKNEIDVRSKRDGITYASLLKLMDVSRLRRIPRLLVVDVFGSNGDVTLSHSVKNCEARANSTESEPRTSKKKTF